MNIHKKKYPSNGASVVADRSPLTSPSRENSYKYLSSDEDSLLSHDLAGRDEVIDYDRLHRFLRRANNLPKQDVKTPLVRERATQMPLSHSTPMNLHYQEPKNHTNPGQRIAELVSDISEEVDNGSTTNLLTPPGTHDSSVTMKEGEDETQTDDKDEQIRRLRETIDHKDSLIFSLKEQSTEKDSTIAQINQQLQESKTLNSKLVHQLATRIGTVRSLNKNDFEGDKYNELGLAVVDNLSLRRLQNFVKQMLVDLNVPYARIDSIVEHHLILQSFVQDLHRMIYSNSIDPNLTKKCCQGMNAYIKRHL
ncbi:BA75_03122T0 [Komagataella pastoris]|uniref:BA75_03122T0 n=1 Tax=Komagataella pastoris TaxID=4922 RepID=A0A1B2JBE3_PICPA|nr:BA75_03122T0 [Komagataella pastoris]